MPKVLCSLLLILCAACASDPQKVVASSSPLAPESERAIVPPGGLPEQKLDDPNRIVARVNDEVITFRSLVAEYGEALRAIGNEDPEVVRQVVDSYALRLIQFRLLAQAAEKMAFNVTPEDIERVAEFEDEEARKRGTTLEADLEARGIERFEWEADQVRLMKIRSFYAITLGSVRPDNPKYRARADTFVRPAEVRAWYDRHIAEYREEERATLQAIFVRTAAFEKDGATPVEARQAAERAALVLIARARGGEDFGKLLSEAQPEPLEAFREPLKRGDRKGDAVEEFAWSAKQGDVSEPVALKSGFLVLRLARRTENRLVPFEEARPGIEETLGALKRQLGQIQIQLDLLADATIEPPRLKKMLADRLQKDLAGAFGELSR
ncbi:MAG: peptidylprolyl isomerase [Planctomycetes bacterium]|nr:peptidylprolyl isomerase [Planctomycetota bacterium]